MRNYFHELFEDLGDAAILRLVAGANEWEAGRRIGGLVAVPEPEFFPDHHACERCKAKWMAG